MHGNRFLPSTRWLSALRPLALVLSLILMALWADPILAQAATPTSSPMDAIRQILSTQTPSANPAAAADGQAAPPSGQQLTLVVPDLGNLNGTIVANNAPITATLFLDGQFYAVPPGLSVGLDLTEVNAAITIYTCAARMLDAVGVTDTCFWEPHVLVRNGFYEVQTKSTQGGELLTLVQAKAPGPDQIRLHNRAGAAELLFYDGRTFQIPAGALQQIAIPSAAQATLYLRHCLVLGQESNCEWLPHIISGGATYALTSNTRNSAGMQVIRVGAVPILGEGSVASADQGAVQPITAPSAPQPIAANTPVPAKATPTAFTVTCQLIVTGLRVRAGPGQEYQTLTTLSQNELSGTPIGIIGRSADGAWFALSEIIEPGGWIASNDSLIACEGDLSGLKVATITDGRLADPVVQAPAQSTVNEPTPEPTPDLPPTATPIPGPPAGMARLIINNSVGTPIRITFKKEYDLEIEEQLILDVEPGRVTFSISSPAIGSANGEFTINPDESLTMWMQLVPNPDSPPPWKALW